MHTVSIFSLSKIKFISLLDIIDRNLFYALGCFINIKFIRIRVFNSLIQRTFSASLY